MHGPSVQTIQQISELLFFDNLALFYVMERTPPRALARSFHALDGRLSGSFLGLMNPEQRQMIHALMAEENDGNAEKNNQAVDALVITANDCVARGFIRKQGRHFFGTPRDERLEPQG